MMLSSVTTQSCHPSKSHTKRAHAYIHVHVKAMETHVFTSLLRSKEAEQQKYHWVMWIRQSAEEMWPFILLTAALESEGMLIADTVALTSQGADEKGGRVQ